MSLNVENSLFSLVRTNEKAKVSSVQESLLQESEKDIIWYRDNFFGKPHYNFIAVDSPRGPLSISLIQEGGVYKAIIRSSGGSERLSLPCSSVRNKGLKSFLGITPSKRLVLNSFSKNIPTSSLTIVRDPSIANDLFLIEERQVIRSYKFGVGYLKPNQSTEKDMLSNHTGFLLVSINIDLSENYLKFLSFLGEIIDLKGWKNYRVKSSNDHNIGLDVAETSNTGTQSVYTKWQGYEIMFHVATFLPYSKTDVQQLERKRHIGNDIVNIIYQDDDATPFNVSSLSSHQTHVIAVLSPHQNGLKLKIIKRTDTPEFSPEMPETCILGFDSTSRDFFFHKVVNAERAAYKAPSFESKISRTRNILLQDLANKYNPQ